MVLSNAVLFGLLQGDLNEIVSWPITAVTHCKAVLILIIKVLAADYFTITSACVLVWLNVYTSCLTHCQRTWSTHMGEQKCHF